MLAALGSALLWLSMCGVVTPFGLCGTGGCGKVIRDPPLFWIYAAGFALAVVLAPLGHSLRRYGKKLAAMRAEEVMHSDQHRPVLLLRSFADDEKRAWTSVRESEPKWPGQGLCGERLTFEEMIVEELGNVGPVIAIGCPGDRLPAVGAARTWVANDDWQARVVDYLDKCSYAVMIMDQIEDRNGLAWELRQVLTRVRPENIIFVVPPVAEWEAKLRWAAFRECSDGRLPSFPGGTLAAGFRVDGTCIVLGAQDRRLLFESDETRYRKAIRTLSGQRTGDVLRPLERPKQKLRVPRSRPPKKSEPERPQVKLEVPHASPPNNPEEDAVEAEAARLLGEIPDVGDDGARFDDCGSTPSNGDIGHG
jgi:hypothetical protein